MVAVRFATFVLTFATLFRAVAAQEVVMSDGEVIAGSVVSVDGSRAKVRATDGAMRVVGVDRIDCEHLADGTTKRHAAQLVKGPLDAPMQALLTKLQKGDAVPEEQLMPLVAKCTQEAVDVLGAAAQDKNHKARLVAARILAMTATKEGMRAAIDAAKADTGGALWKALSSVTSAGASIAAIDAAGARADVEAQMTSKDKNVRFGCAWVAAKLGSKEALPVLATFVGDPDHHVRESAATCLGECGDASGAKLLITMCSRERSPEMEANKGADAETRALVTRFVARERIHSCELLGKLQCKEAVPTLTALGKHKDPVLAAAAKKALEAIGG